MIVSLTLELKFFLSETKRYLHNIFEKWDPEHLELDEDSNLNNDTFKNVVQDEGMQYFNMDD